VTDLLNQAMKPFHGDVYRAVYVAELIADVIYCITVIQFLPHALLRFAEFSTESSPMLFAHKPTSKQLPVGPKFTRPAYRMQQPTMRIARRCTAMPLPRALPLGQTDGWTDRQTLHRFNTLITYAVRVTIRKCNGVHF